LKPIPPAFLAGSLAGLALALHPDDTRRVTITIYFLTRTLEFCYNLLDDKGYLPREKPWWFGSWLIFPLSSAQLLHAFVFDRDCFPQVNPGRLLTSGLRRFYSEIFVSVYYESTRIASHVNGLARSLSSRRLTRHYLLAEIP
jgi:hypothetical protein